MEQMPTSSTSPRPPLPISWIESLFKRMSWVYGARFADMWAGVDPVELKQYWAHKLGELSRTELATGYRMLETKDWPPTLPEFMKLCRPNLDPEVAFHEALEQGRKREGGSMSEPDVWSHAAIYWAWVKIGNFAIANQGYQVLRQRWAEALREYAEDPNLPPVPTKRQELPAPGKARLQPERARQLLADLKLKGMPMRGAGVRQTGWADVVLERHARGEDVSIAALEFAQQAKGLRP